MANDNTEMQSNSVTTIIVDHLYLISQINGVRKCYGSSSLESLPNHYG